MFAETEKNWIRETVCRSLKLAVNDKTFAPEKPAAPALLATGGCFVTYKTRGDLRGCLGCFAAEQPRYLTIAAYANFSATADPRFDGNRLRDADLPEIDFEVSVLSPLEPCAAPEKITLGVHGVYIRDSRGRSGCFLPQVAVETGWNVEEFWRNCCAGKAGLPPDFWRSTEAQRFTFTAEIIAGKYRDFFSKEPRDFLG